MRQLKSLLAEIGVGQRAVAKATGLPVTTINRLCHGQPLPPSLEGKPGKARRVAARTRRGCAPG